MYVQMLDIIFHHYLSVVLDKDDLITFEVKRSKVMVTARPDMVKNHLYNMA